MKIRRIVAGSAVLLALTGGCAAAQEQVSLRMTIWSANQAHLALFNAIADEFHQAHPNVTVRFESLPFDTYTTALTTEIAGGNAPDMAWIFETSAPDFVSSGALLPLTTRLASVPGYDLGDLVPTATERWSQNGVLYAYPLSTSPFAMFVNNDLIRKAGARTPAELIGSGEWSWDNAFRTAAAVARSGAEGLVVRDFNYQNWQYLSEIWDGWGAAPWGADGTCTMAERPMVDAITAIHAAIFDSGAIPGPGKNVDFFAGGTAMTTTQISRATLLPKTDGFDWDLVPLPEGPAGPYALIGQAGLGVMKSGANADMAAEFVAFMTDPKHSAQLSRFFPSARLSLLNGPALKPTNPLLSQRQIEDVVIAGIQKGTVLPGHAGFARLQQLVRAGLDAVWRPNADIPGTLKRICGQIGPLLRR